MDTCFSEPTENFGWTFFKIAFNEDLHQGIEQKFADMISRYKFSNPEEKFCKIYDRLFCF